MRKIELLAPAGNFECLIAAVQNGADAVYISGKSFGARSFADNFDNDELEKAVDYCHLRGVKVHVTVNTLVKDSEFRDLSHYIDFLSRVGTDAVIVQDWGVFEAVRRIAPNLPVHASTQMTIHNLAGVKTLERMGAERIVLSRELTIDEIGRIAGKTNAEIEVFGHGALCMSYSGQCLMSSIIGGRSGNRGKCAQPCRLPYSVSGSEKAFYMSLKDLRALEFLPELTKIGVSSLKIEGRMKGAAYVAAVTSIYRSYIDNPRTAQKADLEKLNEVFNRGGYTSGYLTGEKGPEMFAFDKPDNPYLKNDNSFLKSVKEFSAGENKKLRLTAKIVICEGEKTVISAEADALQKRITVVSEENSQTAKKPLSEDYVRMQLSKTGGTPFEFEKIDVEIIDNPFVSAAELNELRRRAISMVEKEFLGQFKRKVADLGEIKLMPKEALNRRCSRGFICEVSDFEQFNALKDFPFELFYVPLHIVSEKTEQFINYKNKTAIVLPVIVKNQEFDDVCEKTKALLERGFNGAVISNAAFLGAFKGYNTYSGFRMNIFNSLSLNFLHNEGVKIAELSPELNLKQIKAMNKASAQTAVMAYGRLGLMVSENCVLKNGGCCPCNKVGHITDRMGMVFPVIKDGNSCVNVVLNCKKTFTAHKIDEIFSSGIDFCRLYFSDEDETECKKVADAYLNKGTYMPSDFTNAHFYKGVV